MDVIEKQAISDLQTIVDRWDAEPFAAIGYDASQERRVIRECLGLVKRLAALTPPEGYVLVPVELPVEMEIAFMEAWVSKRRCIDDPEMQDAWEAALAARPEVKP
ncbi:hypothetical protein [Stenotrophomonas forensis]|uniref:hypothetical protein n=1 Tax=Stenotrophomonas forensis TaxID=2871169 RepID=UPI0039C63148